MQSFDRNFIVSLIFILFSGVARVSAEYQPVEIYNGLRRQVLALTAEQISATPDQKVLAVLMETGFPEGVTTLVAIVDGTTSLYFSNGGGQIGAGQHDAPNKAAKKLVAESHKFIDHLKRSKNFPLPSEGNTRFYLVTRDGVYSSEAKEENLGEGKEPLSPLFHLAHELMTRMRMIEDN